ncbi:uncharacterized protein LOC116936379 [Daphnia magna]|uniref:uncharacterized protein LOC116936379 n=1 Tax=Daphnia magna TaxID=35525 RepID=UPI0006E846F1|nr:uncharacterized protein LOC116936379 [Daphnia magna]XP_045034726.1 uncharacterized protein LOC116936379 [Daphnia magna]
MLAAVVQLLLSIVIFSPFVTSEISPTNSNTSLNPALDVRDGKFFGLFETVINNNRACRALSGDIGTCLSYPECFAFRGNISGACGRGFGLCCVTTKTCQGVIYANNTYFVNQGYPASYTAAGQCYTTVNRLAPNICQLRLDFEAFSIAQPESVEHRCVTDSFVVTGTTSPVPVICGDNAGQHMYLNIGYNSTTPIMLTMITSNLMVGGVASARNWKIRVSQIPCNEGFAAPPGCLQYFTGSVGVIRSFNFFFESRGVNTARQLSFQDYTICIRQESNFCEMQYNPCPDQVNLPGLGFSISGALTAGATTVASGVDAACTADYLMIPCGSDIRGQAIKSNGAVCAARLCGSAFNSINAETRSTPVFTRSVPFELRYFTNGLEAGEGEQGNLGFCLTYQQEPCPASTNRFQNIFI